MNERKLKAAMALSGKSVTELSFKCGMSTVSFYRKTKGLSDFTQKEIMIIRDELGLSDEELCDIFFTNVVS